MTEPAESKIKSGDFVKLKKGDSPIMAVAESNPMEQALMGVPCKWFSEGNGAAHEGRFPEESLELVK